MLFSRAALLIGGFLYANRVAATITPDEVITNIQVVTSISGNLNSEVSQLTVNVDSETAESIALVRPPFSIINQHADRTSIPVTFVQSIGTDFGMIVNHLENDVSVMAGTTPFDPPSAKLIVNVLNTVRMELFALYPRPI
jgi:hypothetical protein